MPQPQVRGRPPTTEEGRKEKGESQNRKRKGGLRGDTDVWLTQSSLVLPSDVPGLHSSVHSTQAYNSSFPQSGNQWHMHLLP